MGTAPQTSIATRAKAVPGQLYGSGHVIEPATNEEASAGIAFGVMVKNGTAGSNPNLVKLLTATSEKLAGIAVFNHYYNRDTEVDTDGLQPDAVFGLLRKGQIWVKIEETVAVGDPVRVRAVVAGAEQAGAFRTSADSTDCFDISTFAQWRQGGTASEGVALLEVDMANAGLADPD